MASTFRDLQAAFQRKSGFQVISHVDTQPNKLRIIGRLENDRLGVNLKNWLFVVGQILDVSDEGKMGWSADISKQYLRRGTKGNKRTLYAWRLLFEGEALHTHYDQIIRVIQGSPHASRGEITEFPLTGSSANRGDMGSGKGAWGVGSAPIGQNLRTGR